MDEKVEEPDWLTEMDKEILGVLSSELILTPSIIAENIDRSRKGVSNRISSLQAGELVRKVDRGKYRITSEGMTVWEQCVDGLAERRRFEVAERRLIQKEFGVSKEEYLDEAKKEHQRIQDENTEFENPYQEAFDRVEERLRERNEETNS